MIKPTIAEERIARLIAFWHGQKVIVVSRDRGNLTVAALAGFDSGWYWEIDRYVEARWPEYAPAAREVLRQRGSLILEE